MHILIESEFSTKNCIFRPLVTITGARNAKLICIKDDNSIVESDEGSNQLETNPIENQLLIKCVASHTQTEISGKGKKNKTTQRPSTNMKRLAKSSKKIETLPKEYAVSVIQYKLDFSKYCKNNSMYRRTASIVPWKLMSK